MSKKTKKHKKKVVLTPPIKKLSTEERVRDLQLKHNELARAYGDSVKNSNTQLQILQQRCDELEGRLRKQAARLKTIVFYTDRSRCEFEALKESTLYDQESYDKKFTDLLQFKFGITSRNEPTGKMTVTRYNCNENNNTQ